tara:strand:- start:456 stop:581 length:126 start_codon:yes stop_codon:yes gene_type:complete
LVVVELQQVVDLLQNQVIQDLIHLFQQLHQQEVVLVVRGLT